MKRMLEKLEATLAAVAFAEESEPETARAMVAEAATRRARRATSRG